MKRLIVLTVMVLLLSAVVLAQMDMNKEKTKADSTMKAQKTGMMGKMNTMKNMQGNCDMMLADLLKLQEHTDMMMSLNDMAKLKTELQAHKTMITAMHDKMVKHKEMCGSMMSQMKDTLTTPVPEKKSK